MHDIPRPIRDNPLWKQLADLATYMYARADNIATEDADEKWRTESKLRNAANDLVFYGAQAIGSATAVTSEYDWSSTRKNLFTLQALYIFAGKQKLVKLDPDVVVLIDKLLLQIDNIIAENSIAQADKTAQELEPWLEKYRLWQKMQD